MRILSMALPIIIAVFVAVSGLSLISAFPMPPEGIAAEKYAGFSGVLTISFSDSVREQFPGLQRWLTDITNLFEKRNRGVYLRCVDSAAVADILVCTAADAPARGSLDASAILLLPAFSTGDDRLPIAADGYILGVNGDIPTSLQEIPCGWNDGLALPWIALCEQFSPISTHKSTISSPEIGLISAETPEPTAAPTQGSFLAAENLVCDASDALFSRFLAGDIAAMPLTGNQAAKIRAGQTDGKWPEIRLLNAAAYTDRVAYAVIPQSGRADAQERAAAAQKFLLMLAGDEAQQRLKRQNLFPVAITEPLYQGVNGMAAIESALRRSDLVVSKTISAAAVNDFLQGNTPAREIMRALRNQNGG